MQLFALRNQHVQFSRIIYYTYTNTHTICFWHLSKIGKTPSLTFSLSKSYHTIIMREGKMHTPSILSIITFTSPPVCKKLYNVTDWLKFSTPPFSIMRKQTKNTKMDDLILYIKTVSVASRTNQKKKNRNKILGIK